MNLSWGGARSGRCSPPASLPPRCCFSPWPRVARPSVCRRSNQPSKVPSRKSGLPRSYHSAAVVNGKIYLMGGAGADNKPFASVQVYDPATGTWAARANMPTARALFGASAVGGTIYAVGGTIVGVTSSRSWRPTIR